MHTPANPTLPPVKPCKSGDPYCSHCGYSLVGATESAVCPECGRPLVEILTRDPAVVFRTRPRRFRSEATLFGWPVVHVALGPDLEHGERRGVARGIVAIGDVAIGGVAVGGTSFGVVAVGGLAVGACAVGGCSLAVVAAIGGAAVSLGVAAGGGAVGALAAGGAAAGFAAEGGAAIGYYARGGGAIGMHTVTMAQSDPAAASMFQNLVWFFGPASSAPQNLIIQPFATTVGVCILPAVVIMLMAAVTVMRRARTSRGAGSGWNERPRM